MADIALQGVTKKFGANTALRDMDLDIKDGEFFVLLGSDRGRQDNHAESDTPG